MVTFGPGLLSRTMSVFMVQLQLESVLMLGVGQVSWTCVLESRRTVLPLSRICHGVGRIMEICLSPLLATYDRRVTLET